MSASEDSQISNPASELEVGSSDGEHAHLTEQKANVKNAHLTDPIEEAQDLGEEEKGQSESPSSKRCGGKCHLLCGLTGQTITGVAVGFVLGVCIREAEPSKEWQEVLGFAGELFIQALKMVVVPLIATGMILAICKLGDISKVKTIGTRALSYYLCTTFLAGIEGLVWVAIFNPGAGAAQDSADVIGTGADCIRATNAFCGTFESWRDTYNETTEGADWNRTNQTYGACSSLTQNVCPHLQKKDTLAAFLDIGRTMLPPNFVGAYLEMNILGVIVFCLLFGYFLNKQQGSGPAMKIFEVFNGALMEMVNLIITFTPFGVGSLVCGEVVKQANLWADFAQLGVFIATVMCGELFHAFVVYPTIYFIFTRSNPYKKIASLSGPMCTAFATSSSAATLPVTIRTVEKGGVHEDISRFMLPLGATINMDGSAIYFPIAVIFIANWTGQGPLSAASQISIAFVSAFVSIGAAPIPSAGLVYLILIMNSAGLHVTGKVSLVLAIDWFLDRLQTMVNVTGDSMGANLLEFYRRKDEAKLGKSDYTEPTMKLEKAQVQSSVNIRTAPM